MENVTNNNQIQELKDNKIIGNPTLANSNIKFIGINNILYCENDVNLVNCDIQFKGNNSLIYLSRNENNYSINIHVFQDCTVYIGRDNTMAQPISINIQEHQNLIIGDDCIISSGTIFRTSDAYLIYDTISKKRINDSRSIFIGDHVWIGHQTFISKGSKIGSGAILDNNTYVPSNYSLKSNAIFAGNPAQLIKDNVFFTKDYNGGFKAEDTLNCENYNSRIYIYGPQLKETLDLITIDKIISELRIDERIDFIQKLFVRNKLHDRFSV